MGLVGFFYEFWKLTKQSANNMINAIDNEFQNIKKDKETLEAMSDDDLRKNAITKGTNFLGGNKYRAELIRREENRKRLEDGLQKAKEPKRGFL